MEMKRGDYLVGAVIGFSFMIAFAMGAPVPRTSGDDVFIRGVLIVFFAYLGFVSALDYVKTKPEKGGKDAAAGEAEDSLPGAYWFKKALTILGFVLLYLFLSR